MDFARVLELLNDATVKTALLFVGGFILKKWPAFVNKAIPVVLAIASGLVSLLAAMFPAAAGGTTPALYVASAFVPAGVVQTLGHVWASPVVSALVPLWLASGLQSTAKNTRQWAALGWKLWQVAGR